MIKIFAQCRNEIHAIFHNTGGGQTKSINFGNNLHYIKDNLFPLPPLFELIQESSQTRWEEMYQTFNMGHRMEIICSESIASEFIIPIAKEFDVEAQVIGHVEKSPETPKNVITIESEYGNFKYYQTD
jgi:phosphoribosylformylglycinamidine cyclo-ligase